MSSSGSTLPYQFRPNKYVDRQIFFNLLERYSKFQPIEKAGYVSMGAYTMSDHSQIYRRFGINRLYSFDGEAHIPDRSFFNRPTHSCICKEEKTTTIAKEIPRVRSDLGLGSEDPLIVWFDYTGKLNEERLKDIKLLLGALSEGDIARFTFNAVPTGYLNGKDQHNRRLPDARVPKSRKEYFTKLFGKIGLDASLLPKTDSDYSDEKVPSLIVEAVAYATIDSLEDKPALDFELLSSIHYKDGADMVTITGAMVSGQKAPALRQVMDDANWAFSNSKISEPFPLSLNQMTLREYLTLDRLAASDADIKTVKKELGFAQMGDVPIEDVYREFRAVSRFYPSFLEVAT